MGIIQSKKRIKASTVHAAPDFLFFYPRGTAAGSRQEVERIKKEKQKNKNKKAGWGGFSGTV